MSRSLLLVIALAGGTADARDAALPNASVPAMDLQRYSGEWHEIARLPMFFQRKCVANITATYTPRADGTVGVRNACDEQDGTQSVSEGAARTVAGHPGRLEVRFAPGWLAWAPMVWADYWVVDLDPDYRWAVVGGPDRKYVGILSRTPTRLRAQYDAIIARASQRGYPVDKLVLPTGTLD